MRQYSILLRKCKDKLVGTLYLRKGYFSLRLTVGADSISARFFREHMECSPTRSSGEICDPSQKETPPDWVVFLFVCSDLNRCQSFFPYPFRNSDRFKRSNKGCYRHSSNDRQPYLIIFHIQSMVNRKLRCSVAPFVKKQGDK